MSGNPNGRPKGTRSGLKALIEAINSVEEEAGISFLVSFVRRAMKRDILAAKLLDKLVASPKQVELIDVEALKKTRKVMFRKIADE